MNFRACIFAGLLFAVLIVAINVVAFSRASSEFDIALDMGRTLDRLEYGVSNLSHATGNYAVFSGPQFMRQWQDAHDWLEHFLIEHASVFQRAGLETNGLESALDHLGTDFRSLVQLRSGSRPNSSGSLGVAGDEKRLIAQLFATNAEIHREVSHFDTRAEAISETALQNHLFTFIAVYGAFLIIIGVGIFILYAFVLGPLQSLDHAIERIKRGDFSYRIRAMTPHGFGRVCGAFNDMLDHRVTIERDLEQKALMLSQSNAELESFAYVASHDLKAPLRGITNLVDWISTDLNGEANETTTRHLDLLKGRAQRMDALLEGLLKYSRVGRVQTNFETVDTQRLIQQIGADLDAGNQFRIGASTSLPVFRAERIPFEQVLRNLISNAIKHHDRGTGRITVDAQELDEFFEFTVSDDGPGIAPRYHEKVFGMFQTLRPRDEVEGSGMGLALVKKVIEHHGGKISIQSNPETERGTTLRFTWPKSEEAVSQ